MTAHRFDPKHQTTFLIPHSSFLVALLIGLALGAAGCDWGGSPNPPVTAVAPAPGPATAAPARAPAQPTASDVQRLVRDAYAATKVLPFFHSSYEQRGTGSRDFRLDVAFQGPARAVMTLTMGTQALRARTINGAVYIETAADQWELMQGFDREIYPLAPQPLEMLRNYNVVRSYGWALNAATGVEPAGMQEADGRTLAIYRFQVPPAAFGAGTAPAAGGPPGATGQVWIDPTTKLIHQLELTVNARYLQTLLYPTPTPGGPPATLPPDAATPLPDGAVLRYRLLQINVPVEVPNPPGVDAPTYPPGPNVMP